jgi:hypothetical protein
LGEEPRDGDLRRGCLLAGGDGDQKIDECLIGLTR